ncbi:hypothetical protein CIP107521_02162 [Corynebacterium diphtheriae]|nr:hypothetical protein CIP107521_02162 [Corynebacterium diphtheriae]
MNRLQMGAEMLQMKVHAGSIELKCPGFCSVCVGGKLFEHAKKI